MVAKEFQECPYNIAFANPRRRAVYPILDDKIQSCDIIGLQLGSYIEKFIVTTLGVINLLIALMYKFILEPGFFSFLGRYLAPNVWTHISSRWIDPKRLTGELPNYHHPSSAIGKRHTSCAEQIYCQASFELPTICSGGFDSINGTLTYLLIPISAVWSLCSDRKSYAIRRLEGPTCTVTNLLHDLLQRPWLQHKLRKELTSDSPPLSISLQRI